MTGTIRYQPTSTIVIEWQGFIGPILHLTLSPVRHLKPAAALSSNHEITVPVAELDLGGVAASVVHLLSDGGRAFQARSRLALDDVAAVMDADCDGLGVEVGLQHRSTRASIAYGADDLTGLIQRRGRGVRALTLSSQGP